MNTPESQAVRELRRLLQVSFPLSAEVIAAGESVLSELAACQAERSEDKKYIEDLCADICKMEDVLGFKNDCTDKSGAFVPTIGPWLERVRDLIASEGELGDVKDQLATCQAERDKWIRELEKANHEYTLRCSELASARAAAAEMRNVIMAIWRDLCSHPNEYPPKVVIGSMVAKALSTDCGRGYVPVSELEPFKEVASWAQAVLTALNVGDVAKDSPLHLKLREVMIQHRERLEALKGGKP